jgi:hypothetical protein
MAWYGLGGRLLSQRRMLVGPEGKTDTSGRTVISEHLLKGALESHLERDMPLVPTLPHTRDLRPPEIFNLSVSVRRSGGALPLAPTSP